MTDYTPHHHSRYLGGLLSAYELNLSLNGVKDEALIKKSQEVADKMAYAWTTPDQKIPFGCGTSLRDSGR